MVYPAHGQAFRSSAYPGAPVDLAHLPWYLGCGLAAVVWFHGGGTLDLGWAVQGWTLLHVSFVSVLILLTSFAAEGWEKHLGPALVPVVGTKNIIAFGISYGLGQMLANLGSIAIRRRLGF